MNNIDRLFRVIYRELPQSIKFENIQNISLSEKSFCDNISSAYMILYPNNYNSEEVYLLIEQAKKILISSGAQEKFLNPAFLFIHFANKLFTVKNQILHIDFDSLFDWDGLVCKVDSLLFKAAFLGTNIHCNSKSAPIIKHDEKRIYNILKQGVYENHMHLKGSGYNWEMNWRSLSYGSPLHISHIYRLAKTNCLSNPKLTYIIDNASKLRALRLYLSAHLHKDYVRLRKIPIAKILSSSTDIFLCYYKDAFDELLCLYDKEMLIFKDNPQKSILEEEFFLVTLFKKLAQNELEHLDQNLFNLYISLLCTTKFCFIQDNIGMGFERFKSRENVKELFITHKNNDIYSSVFDKYYTEQNIKGIEFRVAPRSKASTISLIKELDRINDTIYNIHCSKNLSTEKIKFGIIFHYIKDKSAPSNHFLCRYHAIRLRTKKDFSKVSKSFSTNHGIQYSFSNKNLPLVGIDAANYEIGCPPEIFSQYFRFHRKENAARSNIGFTYHVGEDFVGLASGLRAIDDVLELMNFKRGDRLGHANALGIDIDDFLNTKRNLLIISLQEHVDDLAWIYRILSNSSKKYLQILYAIEKLYFIYATQLFCNASFSIPDIYDYSLSQLLRGDSPTAYLSVDLKYYTQAKNSITVLDKMKCTYNHENILWEKAFSNPVAKNLYHHYLYDMSLYQKGNEVLTIVYPKEYIVGLKLAQRELLLKIYNKNIIIEANPSSNKKISSVYNYCDMPALKFNQLYKKDAISNSIPICINTDDSAIFQTNLTNEYSLIALSLLKANYDREQVFNYIDALRQSSCNSTFLDHSN